MKPDFLVVGTPRSGTTLVQRLACELAGVRVPPETHLLSRFARPLLERRTFPLEERALREELGRYLAIRHVAGLPLSVDGVVERLGGRCSSVLELFGAVVEELGGPAEVLGEKTPSHLLWWRPLTDALPGLRIVVVVRDPRAVVASYRTTWDRPDADVIARRWLSDQRQTARAAAALGPRRCVVLRYEDVVLRPDDARGAVAALLGVPPAPVRAGEVEEAALRLPWETWKARASETVSPTGVEGWRDVLTPREARDVAAIARPAMARFGYEPGSRGALLRMAPARHAARLRFLHHRGRKLLAIRRAGRRLASPPAHEAPAAEPVGEAGS